MIVRWTSPAAEDLRQIARFIRRDGPTAARHVAKTLFDAANGLDLFPNRGRAGRIAGTRELVFPGWPYILVYEVREQAIEVLHIYHGAQNWQ
jgi:addiction module RelE/StbE family toxin